MLAVALSMGQLTARIREQAQDAGEREGRARALYALSKDLSEVGDLQDQLRVVTRHISEAGRGEATVFLDGSNRKQPEIVRASQAGQGSCGIS